jgi:defect-in-organelle-trafficking protein DotD
MSTTRLAKLATLGFRAGILAGMLLLAACGPRLTNDHPQVVVSPDKVSMMLADAADKSSEALQTLAAVEQARSPAVSIAPVDDAPPELQRAITVNWVGPVEPIAKLLADRAGYEFRTIGSPPPVPIVVSLDVTNSPVIDVLRSLGLQLGLRADIRVDGPGKAVELHYAPNTGVGG